MAAPAAAPPVEGPDVRRARIGAAAASLHPTWSTPAAFRALRATLVVPTLFAVCSQVVGDLQMATFAAFGGFATLVLAGFGGTRRDKLVAHTALAVVGSVLLVIGTAVNSSTALAAVVTVAVAFCVLFAGLAGPNAASGATAVLLAYVLPAASPGTLDMVPSRLAGWWLASAAGTLAVLTLSPRPAGDRLRAAAAAAATATADQLDAALAGTSSPRQAEAALAAKHALVTAFTEAPYRPTGLAVPDQALGNLVETLQWCTGLVIDTVREGTDLAGAAEIDRRLLGEAAGVLRDTGRLLAGANVRPLLDDLAELGTASAARVAGLAEDGSGGDEAIHVSFHARIVAAAARTVAADALITTGRVDPAVAAAERSRWEGDSGEPTAFASRFVLLDTVRRVVSGNASVRSVWFLNSARGAVALAAAVAVADLTNVQHGFWVVLGTLSVLRTSATATGATALRALGGTAIGFFIGAALILAVGSHLAVLWATLPVAVLVASYAPGTAPFLVGQAAFTVTISVLYNILVPVGWKVGVLRVEDVAIGAAVSAVVGALFWPRGAGAVVGDDLADVFHRGGIYLVQGTAWALGARSAPPDAGASTVRAAGRLDDAVRSSMAEQGTKGVPKEQLWRLVGGALRLRLAAQSLAGLPRPPDRPIDPARRALLQEAVGLAGLFDGLAAQLGRTPPTVARELAGLPVADVLSPAALGSCSLWVSQHLDHVRGDLADLATAAAVVADRRARPWWR